MKFVLVGVFAVLFSFVAGAQIRSTDKKLQKAERFFEAGKYKKAKAIYEKEGLKQKSLALLHQASLCYEEITGNDYCQYFKMLKKKGIEMTREELLFYSCDANVYQKIPIP